MSNPYAIVGIPEWPEVELRHVPSQSAWRMEFPWRAMTVVDGELVNTVEITRGRAIRSLRRAVLRHKGSLPETVTIVNAEED